MPDDRPNVLWICTDQQRFDTLGCYGNSVVDTPNVDRLASEGVRFDHAYCQSPVCTPSRASFLTGRYPRTTRCRQNGQSMPDDETFVTRLLADDGYTCGLSGKLHVAPCNVEKAESPPNAERRIDDGYAQFHWSHDTGTEWPTNEYVQWLDRKGVEYGRDPVEGTDNVYTSVPPEHHQTTWCAERAEDFVRANEGFDDPWLFSVNPFDPHHPFDPPEALLEKYVERIEDIEFPDYDPGELGDKPPYQANDHVRAYNTEGSFPWDDLDEREHLLLRAAYYAMVDLVDQQVGRLLDALEETGQREDTLVVFMSDHGEMLGDHGIYLKGPYFYDEAVRVPLVMSGPGVEEGVESDALVELTDLAPTLCDLAGTEQHPGMQGRSLAPILRGESDPDHHRDSVYCAYYNAMPWHDDPEKPFATMVRTEDHKLVTAHRLDSGELYDLNADPGEHENLWDDPEHVDLKADLLDTLATRMAETVDPLPERQADW